MDQPMNTHDIEPLQDAASLLRSYLKLCKSLPRGDSYHLGRIERAITAIEANRQEVKDEQQCPDFWAWLRHAYREPESTTYSIYNMEEAYQAGRASVEADRKRRGEPIGYIMPTALKQLKAGGNAIVGGVSQGYDVPLYTAPQPADTGREVEK